MSFVKLDTSMLNSTIWFDRVAREIFITALLMAEPYEVRENEPQLNVTHLGETGWCVPPGWYGFVPAAGPAIVRRATLGESAAELAAGIAALERMGSPEPESRSMEHEGRRLVRVDRGYIVLNYFKFRDRDHSTAERSKRWREKKKADTASRVTVVTRHARDTESVSPTRDTTQAEGRGQKTEIRNQATPDPDQTRARGAVLVSPAIAEIPDPDADPDRETVCPPGIARIAEERGVLAELAEHLSAPIDSLRQEAQDFETYWVIGGGVDRRKTGWMRHLRQRLVQQHGSGMLRPLGSLTAAAHRREELAAPAPVSAAYETMEQKEAAHEDRLRRARAGEYGPKLQAACEGIAPTRLHAAIDRIISQRRKKPGAESVHATVTRLMGAR